VVSLTYSQTLCVRRRYDRTTFFSAWKTTASEISRKHGPGRITGCPQISLHHGRTDGKVFEGRVPATYGDIRLAPARPGLMPWTTPDRASRVFPVWKPRTGPRSSAVSPRRRPTASPPGKKIPTRPSQDVPNPGPGVKGRQP
jgi:hypothetical protein